MLARALVLFFILFTLFISFDETFSQFISFKLKRWPLVRFVDLFECVSACNTYYAMYMYAVYARNDSTETTKMLHYGDVVIGWRSLHIYAANKNAYCTVYICTWAH